MLLPADIDPRSFLGADAISYSELSTLARCEMAWKLGYTGEREKSAPSGAMKLGTEIHRLWGAWWTGGNWQTTADEKAAWLMERYAERYVPESMFMEMEAIELPLVARFSWGPYFFGFADGLLKDGNGNLWIAELKSTDSLSKVTSLVESLQTKLYIWAARQMGYPVVGAMLDVVRTFKPVRKPLALEESFDRRWLQPSPEQLQEALGQAMRATKARRELIAGETPLRNVGPACSWCFAMAPCYGLEVDIVPEDDTF